MTVVVGTDVYLSVTAADTYWSNRNNSTWSDAVTADKEKALREATQYLDGAYNFIGIQIIANVLAWPRSSVRITRGNFSGITYDDTTIPSQIEDACTELALEALATRLRSAVERGGAIKREKVDVVEVEYQDFAPSHKTYDFVSMILKPLLKGGKLVRT